MTVPLNNKNRSFWNGFYCPVYKIVIISDW